MSGTWGAQSDLTGGANGKMAPHKAAFLSLSPYYFNPWPYYCFLNPLCTVYTLKSILDSHRFTLCYSEQMKNPTFSHSKSSECMELTEAFLTPNILLSPCMLLDNVQIKSYVIFSCHVNVMITPRRNI